MHENEKRALVLKYKRFFPLGSRVPREILFEARRFYSPKTGEDAIANALNNTFLRIKADKYRDRVVGQAYADRAGMCCSDSELAKQILKAQDVVPALEFTRWRDR